MNKQRLSFLLLMALALTAAAVALRRRQEAPEEPPELPAPEPPEPPRIVLPQSVLEEQEDEEQQSEDLQRAAEDGDEPPLRERSFGESLDVAPPRDRPGTAAPGQPEQSNAQEDRSPQQDEAIMGYCMHCRERRPVTDGEEVTTESGRRALSGTCPECGTRIFRFLPSKGPGRS